MSVYVNQYKYDIFVSYADVDNESFEDIDKGWVTTLIKTLKINLGKRLGSKDAFSLWSKEMLPGHISSTYNSIQYVESSAVFLFILSPGYLQSEKCQLELNAFLTKVDENSDRIFIVEYIPEKRPEPLSDLLGYRFFKLDPISGRPRSVDFDSKYADQYRSNVEDLAIDIVYKLKKLKAENISKVNDDLNVQGKELNNSIDSYLNNSLLKWWNELDDNWKKIFKKAIHIQVEPSDSDLEKIVNLQKLDCSNNQLNDLEPLRALSNLKELQCRYNEITNLEPLRALTNLQELWCSRNEISNLKPLRALTNLQKLSCGGNKISDLEPLQALTIDICE
jgi:hypothetical protein